MTLMRQSMLGGDCLRSLQFSLEGAPWATSEPRIVGTSYHAGLEHYYQARKDGTPWTEAQGIAAAFDSFNEEAPTDWHGWETSRTEAWNRVCTSLGYYHETGCAWPDDYEVLGVEVQFTFEWIPGFDAHGTIDLRLKSPDGWIINVDHKTSKRGWSAKKAHPGVNVQAGWYAYWTRHEMGFDTPVTSAFDVLTWGLKSGTTFDRIACHPEHHQQLAVVERARELAVLLAASSTGGFDLPANPSSNLCSAQYCDHWDRCPYGAALGR
jgi:hypothetical protein